MLSVVVTLFLVVFICVVFTCWCFKFHKTDTSNVRQQTNRTYINPDDIWQVHVSTNNVIGHQTQYDVTNTMASAPPDYDSIALGVQFGVHYTSSRGQVLTTNSDTTTYHGLSDRPTNYERTSSLPSYEDAIKDIQEA